MSMEELLAELKKTYLADLPGKIEELKQAYTENDWKSVESSFHKLKGSGKTYGLPEVSELCALLEKLAKQSPTQVQIIFSDSMELLDEIRQKHIENDVFPLQSDQRFQKIKELAT